MEKSLYLLTPSQFIAYQSLGMEKQQQFLYEFGKQSHDPLIAMIFFIFGFHYFYLGETGKQILYMFTLAGFSIWWWIDLFGLKKKVQKQNELLADRILGRLK
ncbi:MAG: hypothetical protein CH6_2555 [Candidatus Kapaibacterium sp.]|nr:MAG: hypothetical protein CH6_2555 [Candidatus Kapabacteria bacterium]